MTGKPGIQDWSPESYHRFRGLRLRPALDLLAQVPTLPVGDVVDLGCGSGAAGAALKTRFPDRILRGVDQSPAMLEEADATDAYTRLTQGDVAEWHSDQPVALIFANAVLNWLPDHARLIPRLLHNLVPDGVLAVQCPKQQAAPSHALLRSVSASLFPDRFDWTGWGDPVLDLAAYDQIFTGLGQVSLWETTYAQTLAPVAYGHPVRHFTESTAARRVLDRLSPAEITRFIDAYDAALRTAYPLRADGSVLFPFRRIFFTLRRASGSKSTG